MSKSLCFTGHRPNKLFGYDLNNEGNIAICKKLYELCERAIVNAGVETFITGMALGIDQWAALVVFELKKKYPHIKLIAAVPCRSQPSVWSKAQQEMYADILRKCDKVVVLSEEYTPSCMQKRNEWMVDHSDFVLAVWDGTKSGTGNCVAYAKMKGKTIVAFHPEKLQPYRL